MVVGPLLWPGFVLSYDMVFVPKPRLSAELLGLTGVPPRAVPSSLLAAILSRAVTGQVAEKLLLFAIFAGAAWGAARLVPTVRPAARVGAGLLYAWNPFTYERILIGHWALLLGYAALPWVVGAAVSLREDEPRAFLRLVLWLAGAAIGGPYTGVLATIVALAIVLAPPWIEGPPLRRAGSVAAAAVVVNLPWLVPALLGPPVPGRPLLAKALFRARPDTPLGIWGSLLSLGGLWRSDLAPPGRHGWSWVPAFVLMVGLAVAGWRLLGRRWPRGARTGLLLSAAAGLLLAAAPSVHGLDAAARWVAGLPGGGFVRDSQKFLMPLALAASVAFGLGIERLLEVVPPTERWLRALASAAALLPLALAPTLAWGLSGRLFDSRYPTSWSRVESIMAADRAPGGVLALPWHAYLPFDWNRQRVVHQPAGSYFSRPVLASSSLEVGRFRLPQEDPWARHADPMIRATGSLVPDLQGLGVRYVLLFKEADWQASLPRLIGMAPVLDTSDLRLYRAGPTAIPSFPAAPVAAVVIGDVLAVGVVLIVAIRLLRSVPWRFPPWYPSPRRTGG